MKVYDLSKEFQGTFQAPRSVTRYIVVHHAAADYPPYYGRDDVAAIANYHKSKGWSGIGYHEVIAQETNNGPVAAYVVSNPTTVRAHVAGRNHECFGICMAANFSKSIPPQQWLDALAFRIVEAKKRWPYAQIVGHKDIALPGHGTTCPGERWAAWKPMLLAQVESMLSVPPPPAPTTPPPVSLPTKTYRVRGIPVYQAQSLTGTVAGWLQSGQPVEIGQTYPNGAGHVRNPDLGFVDMRALEVTQ